MICEKKKSEVPPLSQNNKHKLVSHIAISLIKTILMFWTRRFEEVFNLSQYTYPFQLIFVFEHCYLHAYNSRRGVTTFSAFWHGRLRCLNVALILFRIFGPLLVPPISRTLSRLKRIRGDFALPLPSSKMSIPMICIA